MILETRTRVRSGAMERVEETYREPSGALSPAEHYVVECAKAEDDAVAVVRRGIASGWRFHLLAHGFVDLWAPAVWMPVTYTLRNETLWRAIQAMGVSLTTVGG